MQKLCVMVVLFLSLAFLFSCSIEREPKAISDLSYKPMRPSENIVFIEEDGQFVPFIVASDNYNNEVLLIRKDLLPSGRIINEYGSYYENSDIDHYLNHDYLNSLSIKDEIVLGEIVITDDDSIGFSGDGTKTIKRKVFLLSLTEIGISENSNSGQEGNPIPYFASPTRRIAFIQNNAQSWWLRTPDTFYVSSTYGIGPEGTIGSGNSFSENGIRPCFCVSHTKRVTEMTDDISGQTYYYLLQEESRK